jgi:hypothetical protein
MFLPSHKERLAIGLGILILQAIACALALYFLGHVARGAPAPPAPRFTAELLAGATWVYERGDEQGSIHFYADGSYVACLRPPCGELFAGEWSVERGSLRLTQYRLSECGDFVGPEIVKIELSAAKWPRLEGQSGGVRVVFRDPEREGKR